MTQSLLMLKNCFIIHTDKSICLFHRSSIFQNQIWVWHMLSMILIDFTTAIAQKTGYCGGKKKESMKMWRKFVTKGFLLTQFEEWISLLNNIFAFWKTWRARYLYYLARYVFQNAKILFSKEIYSSNWVSRNPFVTNFRHIFIDSFCFSPTIPYFFGAMAIMKLIYMIDNICQMQIRFWKILDLRNWQIDWSVCMLKHFFMTSKLCVLISLRLHIEPLRTHLFARPGLL